VLSTGHVVVIDGHPFLYVDRRVGVGRQHLLGALIGRDGEWVALLGSADPDLMALPTLGFVGRPMEWLNTLVVLIRVLGVGHRSTLPALNSTGMGMAP